jgi:diguanylate cyclase (GGDEF)-like protein
LARNFLRDLLHSAGYRVRTASTGPGALTSIQRHPPDLLLLDVRLPQVHGLAVCEQVRQTANGPHFPIILVTDPGSKAEMVKGFEAGADDFLWKPVDQAELMARVKGHLRVKSYRDELEREKKDLANVLDISKAATSALSAQAIFRIIVESTARLVDATRCSLIVIRHQGENGQVVASSQHEAPPDFLLDLKLYPEVRQALETRAPVLVQDVDTDPLMAAVREKIRPLGFRSFLVLPISLRDSVVGTLVLTTVRAGRPFSERNLRTCQLVAEIAANALQNAHVFESLELEQVNLQRRALEDERLGVFHWHVFSRRLEEEIARAYRYKQPVACLAIEVEGRPGVEVDPEAVLGDVATLIRQNIRKSDVTGRHPSGRLLLMLPITSEEGTRVKGQRLRALVESHAFGEAPPGQITINIGASAGVPEAASGMDRLVESALAALVKAQSQAPNHIALCPFA